MMVEGTKMNEKNYSGEEIEIERIPTCMIEARSKEMVPVCNYLQTPKIQQTRFTRFFCLFILHILGCSCFLYITLLSHYVLDAWAPDSLHYHTKRTLS